MLFEPSVRGGPTPPRAWGRPRRPPPLIVSPASTLRTDARAPAPSGKTARRPLGVSIVLLRGSTLSASRPALRPPGCPNPPRSPYGQPARERASPLSTVVRRD